MPTIFYDDSHLALGGMRLFVRADQTTGLEESVVQTIRDLDPTLPVNGLMWMDAFFGESVARERLTAVV